MTLTVENLGFAYGDKQTIQQINLSLEKNDILAVLGPNGVGKTTLLKCINRFLPSRTGAVFLDQQNICSLKSSELAKKFATVSQKSDVSRLTVYDVILLGRKPHFNWAVGQQDHEITQEIIALLHLEHLALCYVDEISGGEFQIVQIARVLAQQPQLMILDEPTSNLDISNQYRIMSLIAEVVESKSMMAIISIHDINLAIRFCNTFMLLKDGQVYAQGKKDILTPENIAAVYDIDVYIEHINGIPVVVPK